FRQGQWSSRAGVGVRHIRQIPGSQSAGVEKQPRKTVLSGSANLGGAAVGEWWLKVHRLIKSELLLDITPSISHTSCRRESPWRLLCSVRDSRSTATVAHRGCCTGSSSSPSCRNTPHQSRGPSSTTHGRLQVSLSIRPINPP